MDSSLSRQERDKIRASRANFFTRLPKRDSTSQSEQLDSASMSIAQQDPSPPSKRVKLPNMRSSQSPDTTSSTPLIVRFYDHDVQATDSHNRTQESILSWSDSQLERSHNYIQMLFPLPEGSPYNYSAPVINRKVFDAFRSRSELRDRLRQSFERMLDFYGFAVSTTSEDSEEQKDSGKSEAKDQASTPATDVNIAEQSSKQAAKVNTDVEVTSSTISSPSQSKSSSSGYHIVRGPKWRRNSQNWCVRFDHNHLRVTRILRCLRILGLQTECDAFFDALKRVFDDPAISISERSLTYWQRAVKRPLSIAPDDEDCDWLRQWEDQQEAGKSGESKEDGGQDQSN